MSDRASTPIQLTILRQGELNVVDLAELGSLIPRSETHVDDAFLRDLADETAQLTGSARTGGTGAAARALERVGGLIFSHLLTEPARRRLRDAAADADLYLRLDEQLVHVPWELCHDGRDFLATKFRLARQVITSQLIPDERPARSRGGQLRVLLVADPTATLRNAASEAEQLCAMLDAVPGVDVTLVGGTSLRRIPLLTALDEHDIVHFAGHSHYDPAAPARSGWRLADGVVSASELGKLRCPPALVFSNSCEAGTTAAWEGGYRYEGRVFGIGSAFLLAGVRNYVGTFWVVHDDESVLFATACYRALAAGASLGAAMLEARQAVIAERGWEGLTWASYLLYGDPTFTPLVSAERSTPRRGPESQPAAPRSEYRFDVAVSAHADETDRPTVNVVATPAVRMVGRESESEDLDRALVGARRGVRSVVFVDGPPGIGKTTLVDAFLERVRAGGDVRIARGQSVEQYGAGEAYLPVLEAWSRLGREPGGRVLIDQLRRHAPSWLAQLPGLLDPGEHDRLQRRAESATRERMLREMAELVEAVAAERPLVLVLEDLHWADPSTLDLISYVVQRHEPARLLLIGTYRPAEVRTGDHSLRTIVQELQARRCSHNIHVTPLSLHHVGDYLRGRLEGGDVREELIRSIHHRTDGHPLFLVNVVDLALREGLIAEESGRWTLRGGPDALRSAVPEGLRQLVERQVEALGADDQQMLEVASVAGAEFSVAAVALALGEGLDAIEERCEMLAWRGQFLRADGLEEWPDGTLGGRYRFVHALYQNVLYERMAHARRVRLHRRVAEAKAAAFGTHAGEIAGELAAHFEAARDAERAVTFRTLAGDNAVLRHADHEAIEHFSHAIRQLGDLKGVSQRTERELGLLLKLATPLMSTKGYAATDVERVFERAYALSRQAAEGPHLAPLLRGLVSFYQVRARSQMARDVGEQLLALCERSGDAVARVQAHYGHGVTLMNFGEFEASQSHLEQALALYDPEAHPVHVSVYGGYDPGVACRCWLSWVQWYRGAPDEALRSSDGALELAARLGHPFSLAWAYLSAAITHLNRDEPVPALRRLENASTIAREEGFAYQLAISQGLEAWALLKQGRREEALALLEKSLAAHEAAGAAIGRPGQLVLLAYAKAIAGRVEEALQHIAEGFEDATRTDQPLLLVTLERARGDLLLRSGGDVGEAEACYRRALDLARAFGARALELQAATSLARCWHQQGRNAEARALLAPVYDAFGEGFTLRDLREARDLLAGL